MNYFLKKEGKRFKDSIFVVLFFISNSAIFGQTTIDNNVVQSVSAANNLRVDSVIEIRKMKQEDTSNASNVNFVLWFMGSKQSPNATVVPAGTTAKKQFITSGTAPNKLLIKAFLKKAVNFERGVV